MRKIGEHLTQHIAGLNKFFRNFTRWRLKPLSKSLSTVWVKKSSPQNFLEYFHVKFCLFFASVYPHMLTDLRRFFLIFNKMAVIFQGVLIVFTVSSFGFQQVRLPWLHRQWWVVPIHSTSIHWIIRFGAVLESYHKLEQKWKWVLEFENAPQFFWSVLPEKATDNAVIDNHKQLQTCVSANGRHFKHLMW